MGTAKKQDIDTFHPRDKREPRHFWADNEVVDNHLPNIGVYGFAVYMMLARYANSDTGECDPSISTIATKLAISEPTVKRALKTLEKYNLVKIEHRKSTKHNKLNATNLYTLSALKGWVITEPTMGNEGTHGGQPQTPGVGNEGTPNNTKENKTQEQENTPADIPQPPEPTNPDPIPEPPILKAVPKEDPALDKRTPHQRAIEAYYEGIPAAIRPKIRKYGGQVGSGIKELLDHDYTPEQIGIATAEAYKDGWWSDKIIPVQKLAENMEILLRKAKFNGTVGPPKDIEAAAAEHGLDLKDMIA